MVAELVPRLPPDGDPEVDVFDLGRLQKFQSIPLVVGHIGDHISRKRVVLYGGVVDGGALLEGHISGNHKNVVVQPMKASNSQEKKHVSTQVILARVLVSYITQLNLGPPFRGITNI